MKRKACFLLLTLLMVIFLVACGKENGDISYDETTITIDKNGKITETIVSSFNKDYYNQDELTNEFNAIITKYNASVDDNSAAVLKQIVQKDGNIYVDLVFKDMDAYKAVQNEEFYFGTIREAYDVGFKMDVTLKGVQQGDRIEKVQIMGMSDKHIIIFSEACKIKTYRPITYVSANVELINEKTARSSSESGSGLCYIILDK